MNIAEIRRIGLSTWGLGFSAAFLSAEEGTSQRIAIDNGNSPRAWLGELGRGEN